MALGRLVPVTVVSACLLVAAHLTARSFAWPLIHDAPLMHYIAWRIGEGAVPYRDLFDMNFPGTYLLHLAVLRGLGPGDVAWRAFDLAWLTATSLTLVAFAWPWGRGAAWGGAVFFAVYHLAAGAWQTGQRDFLLCAFLVVGALGVTRWLEEARRRGSLAAGGLALGAAMTIKPHAALLAAALGLLVAVEARRSGRPLRAPLTVFVAATVVVPSTVLAWLAAVGALAAWREIVVGYLLPFYARLGRPASWVFHRWQVWIPIATAVALSLASAFGARRFTVRHRVATVGLAYGVVHHFGQGKGWEYHLYPLAAFAAVLAFAELDTVWLRRRVLAVPLVASLVLALALVGQKGVEAADAGWIRDKHRVVDALIQDLGDLRPGESVQVLDTTAGGIHALLRLRAAQPTRFLYDFHFFHDESAPAVRALRDEFIRDLAARPPRFVVLFERGWPESRNGRLQRFPELARRLETAYRISQRRTEYVIYAKRHDS
jgi:hypothetical protein